VREVQIKIQLPEFVYQVCVKILLFYRWLRYGFPFRLIPLTQGQFTIVDDEDYEKLAKYRWLAVRSGRTFYAERAVKLWKGNRKRFFNVRMHRQLLNVPEGKIVDHINHNGLDNRRANLRIVTIEQNTWNKRKKSGNCSSRYKGVSWQKSSGRWKAIIVYRGKWIFIGYFDDEVLAAKAYDAKAQELFGEYAALNFGKA
jgi:hypothetical protein